MIGGALPLQYGETAIRFMEKEESGKQDGEGKLTPIVREFIRNRRKIHEKGKDCVNIGGGSWKSETGAILKDFCISVFCRDKNAFYNQKSAPGKGADNRNRLTVKKIVPKSKRNRERRGAEAENFGLVF